MTGKLKIDMKRAMKYAWIVTNISLLQLVLGTYLSYPDYSFTNDNSIVYLTLLSFPSSIPAIILAASIIDVYPSVDYVIICLVAFVSGCLQWFWCIPRMVQGQEIISLHLTIPDRETLPIPATNPTRRRKSYQSNFPRAPFDKTGHSPLERAIGIKRG